MSEHTYDPLVGAGPAADGDPHKTAELPLDPATTWLRMGESAPDSSLFEPQPTVAAAPAAGAVTPAAHSPKPADAAHGTAAPSAPGNPTAPTGATVAERPLITGVNVTAVGFGVLVMLAGALGIMQVVMDGAINWARLGPGLFTGIGVVLVVMGTAGVARRRSARRGSC